MTKQIRVTVATALFFIVAIAQIWAIISGNDILRIYTKPLLLTLVAVVYLVSVIKPNFWYVLGMFFCFIGDVLLMFNGSDFFMFGIAAFLLAHIVYIKITSGFLPSHLTFKIISSAFPFVIFFGVLMFLVYPNLEQMLIPVAAYGITISTFGSVTFLNYRSEKSTENLWLFIGAILFILSDSLIGLDKFYQSNEIYSVAIMVTYILAQFLICKAMIVKSNMTE